MQHVEQQRLLAKVEVRLGLDVKIITPYVLEVPKPPSQPIVPVVDAAADCRKRRVELDARIAESDKSVNVACVERLNEARWSR